MATIRITAKPNVFEPYRAPALHGWKDADGKPFLSVPAYDDSGLASWDIPDRTESRSRIRTEFPSDNFTIELVHQDHGVLGDLVADSSAIEAENEALKAELASPGDVSTEVDTPKRGGKK